MESEKLVRSLCGDLRPVRPLRSLELRSLLWGGFALVCVSIGAIGFGVRADLVRKAQDLGFLGRGVLLFLLFILSTRSAFLLSVPGAEQRAGARMLPIAAILAWIGFVAARGWPDAALTSGWSCIVRMSGLALAPTISALVMLRRAAPLSREWTGGLALLSAGSLAMLGTQIVCVRDDAPHLLVWHFGPLLAATVVGIHLGRQLLIRE